MRSALASFAVTVAATLLPALGHSKPSFPDKPLRFIVATPPGSTPDVGGRLVAAFVAEALGQTVIVENRPGVNGVMAAREVLKAEPDGYTYLLAPSSTMSVSPHVYAKQAGAFLKDFTAVAQIYRTDLSVIVRAATPYGSITDVIAAARQQPGKLVGAFAAIGSASHVALERFKQMAGIDIYAVPFNGSPAAALGLASGDADILFETIPATESVVASGKARRLAMTGATRFALAPNTPTVAESGLPDYVVSTWAGLFAREGVPRERLDIVADAIAQAFTQPELIEKLASSGFLPGVPEPAAFQTLWQEEAELWRQTVAQSPTLQQEQ